MEEREMTIQQAMEDEKMDKAIEGKISNGSLVVRDTCPICGAAIDYTGDASFASTFTCPECEREIEIEVLGLEAGKRGRK